MPMTLELALTGGESEMQKKIETRNKEITKIAYRPSTRLRKLESRKRQPYELYTGEELTKRPR